MLKMVKDDICIRMRHNTTDNDVLYKVVCIK
jgi:hypothetical protein